MKQGRCNEELVDCTNGRLASLCFDAFARLQYQNDNRQRELLATVKLLLQDVFYLQQRMMPMCDDFSVGMKDKQVCAHWWVGQNYWVVVCRRARSTFRKSMDLIRRSTLFSSINTQGNHSF